MRVAHPWEPDAESSRPGICSTGVETALLIAAAVAAAGSAYGVYASGQAQGAAADFNAQVAQQQAQAARDAAAVEEEQTRERNRRIQATARARAAASGVVPSEGSPLLILMDNAAQAELEAQRARFGGELTAAGFRGQAAQQQFAARQARTAGGIGAGISLLSSGASIGTRAFSTRNTSALNAPNFGGDLF